MIYTLTDTPTLSETEDILSFAHGGREELRYFLLRLAKHREEEPFFHALAREKSGQMCGYLLCRKQADGWCYGDLLVRSDCRRQNTGKTLLALTAAEAGKRGGKTLYCFVAPDNIPSRRLQLSAGFAEKPAGEDAPGVRYSLLLHPDGTPYSPSRPGLREERPSCESDARFVWELLTADGKTVSWAEAKRLAGHGILTFSDGAPIAFRTAETEGLKR